MAMCGLPEPGYRTGMRNWTGERTASGIHHDVGLAALAPTMRGIFTLRSRFGETGA